MKYTTSQTKLLKSQKKSNKRALKEFHEYVKYEISYYSPKWNGLSFLKIAELGSKVVDKIRSNPE